MRSRTGSPQFPDGAVGDSADPRQLLVKREHERLPQRVPVSLATARTCSVSASVPHSGFSHSTGLPARSARRPPRVQRVGQRDVQRVHVRVVNQGLVALDRPPDAVLRRVLAGPGQSRLATPATTPPPGRHPGTNALRAIRAVPIMPQRT